MFSVGQVDVLLTRILSLAFVSADELSDADKAAETGACYLVAQRFVCKCHSLTMTQ